MNFDDFKKKASTDKEFAQKFVEAKSPAELVELAAAEGYTFTEEDITNNTDVTPEELEQVAGGKCVAAMLGNNFSQILRLQILTVED